MESNSIKLSIGWSVFKSVESKTSGGVWSYLVWKSLWFQAYHMAIASSINCINAIAINAVLFPGVSSTRGATHSGGQSSNRFGGWTFRKTKLNHTWSWSLEIRSFVELYRFSYILISEKWEDGRLESKSFWWDPRLKWKDKVKNFNIKESRHSSASELYWYNASIRLEIMLISELAFCEVRFLGTVRRDADLHLVSFWIVSFTSPRQRHPILLSNTRYPSF